MACRAAPTAARRRGHRDSVLARPRRSQRRVGDAHERDLQRVPREYRVVPVYKGSYAETISSGITAYRTGAAPHLLQVFEVGNGTMAAAVGAVRPVATVLREAGLTVSPSEFLPVIATNYLDSTGAMLSLPFNVSSTVMWINRTVPAGGARRRQAADDVAGHLRRRAADQGHGPVRCALSSAWPNLGSYRAIVDLARCPGRHPRQRPRRLRCRTRLQRPPPGPAPAEPRRADARGGVRVQRPRQSRGIPVRLGRLRDLPHLIQPYGKVASAARFDWTVVPMPFYPDVAAEPRNAILGGGSLYVMQGKSPYEYRGVARFLAFLMEAPQQATLYRNTGYIPTTRAAYAEAVADGFYARHPQLHVAVEELIRRPPTRDTAGLRLGNMLQIRDLWSEEFEAALNGTKSPQQALDDAVSRGNQVLRLFQQRTRK